MLYVDLGYHSLSFNSLDLNLSGWIGQSYLAGMVSSKFTMRSSVPSFVRIEGVMSRQKFYDSQLLFYENSTPTFITEIENFIRASYEWAIGMKTKGYVSLGYGYMSDSYFPTNVTDYSQTSKDKTQYQLGVARVGVESNLLNDNLYPNAGYAWKADVTLSYESSRYTPQGDRSLRTSYNGDCRAAVEGYWKRFFPLSKKVRLE